MLSHREEAAEPTVTGWRDLDRRGVAIISAAVNVTPDSTANAPYQSVTPRTAPKKSGPLKNDIVRYLDKPRPTPKPTSAPEATPGASEYYTDGSAEPGRWLGRGTIGDEGRLTPQESLVAATQRDDGAHAPPSSRRARTASTIPE